MSLSLSVRVRWPGFRGGRFRGLRCAPTSRAARSDSSAVPERWRLLCFCVWASSPDWDLPTSPFSPSHQPRGSSALLRQCVACTCVCVLALTDLSFVFVVRERGSPDISSGSSWPPDGSTCGLPNAVAFLSPSFFAASAFLRWRSYPCQTMGLVVTCLPSVYMHGGRGGGA